MADKLLTPQQELFLSLWTDPKSETFGNAKRSAMKAGYSDEYSDNIMALLPDWLSEHIGDMRRLAKAEANLTEYQNLDIYNGGDKVDSQLLANKIKVDTFLAKTLNKKKYSERIEQTGADGKDLIPDTFTQEEKDKLLSLLK